MTRRWSHRQIFLCKAGGLRPCTPHHCLRHEVQVVLELLPLPLPLHGCTGYMPIAIVEGAQISGFGLCRKASKSVMLVSQPETCPQQTRISSWGLKVGHGHIGRCYKNQEPYAVEPC